MLVLISSSKTLDFSAKQQIKTHTIPVFIKESEELVSLLKDYSIDELMKLMKISKSLAETNFNRFKKWNSLSSDRFKVALFAFKGDVYENIKACSLTASDCEFANNHLRILSGLYGLLRPLDSILPYRLEMGTKLNNEEGTDLYKFWKTKIAFEIIKVTQEKNYNTILNLSSKEYFKAIDEKVLKRPVLNITFKEKQGNTYKTLGLYSKKARGLMVNYIIKNRICQPLELKEFCQQGYVFNQQLSNEKEWVYTR